MKKDRKYLGLKWVVCRCYLWEIDGTYSNGDQVHVDNKQVDYYYLSYSRVFC